MFKCIVVRDRETLSPKGEEVSNDWTMDLMPFALRNANLSGNNVEKLTPERKARDSWNMSKFGNVEWEDITEVKSIYWHEYPKHN